MSGLRVNNDISIEEGVDIYRKSVEAAHADLARNGFTPPNPPQYMTQAGMLPYRGEIPIDITSLTDEQLGYYMGKLSEWNTYVQFKFAESTSQLFSAKSELSLVEAKLRLFYKVDDENKKRSNPERDDCVGGDRRYVEANARVIYWDAMFKYTKSIADGAENAFATVSRRITQRGQEIERERRNQGINQGTNIPQGGPVFGRRS